MKTLEELQAEHENLGKQLTDTKNPDWSKWIDRRNNLSVRIAKLKQKILPRDYSAVENWNLRQFNI